MNFFKVFLGSCLGVIAGLILIFLIGIGMISALASFGDKSNKMPLDKASFLEIRTDHFYPERTDNLEKSGFSFKEDKTIGLNDLVKTLQRAESDPKIKGIAIRSASNALSPASARTLHKALLDFKRSHKPVFAYSDNYSEGAYYIASTADKIMINPNGSVDLKGYGAIMPYMKDLFDKIGIKFNIYYAGQYKSATEPLRLNKMSDQNRLQTREYLSDIYNVHAADIASSRKIDIQQFNKFVDDYQIRTAEDAKKNNLVDEIGYQDDFYKLVSKELGGSETVKPEIVSLNRYFETPSTAPINPGIDRIAVVYAEGDIVDGEGSYGQIGGAKYSRIFRKLRFDNKVKAVVLRVNSPGGSSLASDNILHEIDLIKKAGKPVVVSMGDYAASGGYYISCHADSIFAQQNTLTGSIGVFMMGPDMSKLIHDKLNINMDTVKVGKFSTAFSSVLPWSSEEGLIAQQETDRIYDRFLTVVSEGRKKSKEDIHAIAQGRVWTGMRAFKNGLVDKEGDLNDAIACAARLAKMDKYKTSEYPSVKEPIQRIIDKITDQDITDETLMKKHLGAFYPLIKIFKQQEETSFKPLMRLPYQLNFY